MSETKLIRDHHLLTRNLKLNGKYISNDGGDEGILVDDAGNVGINIPTILTPSTKLEVFNANVQYSTGTIIQSGTGIVGSGTTFTSAMVGSRLVFDDGTDAGVITVFSNVISLTVSTSQTVGSHPSDYRSYKIYYPAAKIDIGASSTALKIGQMSLIWYIAHIGQHSQSELDISSGDFTLDVAGNIDLNSAGNQITFGFGGNPYFYFFGTGFRMYNDASATEDYVEISASNSHGGATIQTVDASGNNQAKVVFDVDGDLDFQTGANKETRFFPATKTLSGTTDSSIKIAETLNLDTGAGGSDIHHGIWYAQTQTDLTGWDKVYLMYLDGGDSTKRFSVAADGTVSVGGTISSGSSITLNSDGDITLDADGDNITMKAGSAGSGLDFIQSGTGDYTIKNLTSDKDIIFNVNDGGADTEVMRLDGSASSLFIASSKNIEFGNVGEYIYGNGTNMFIKSSGVLNLDATGNIHIDSSASVILDSATGVFKAMKSGTEFSPANSAYAGMILGYTDIGLDEVHATLNLTTSYVVPTDEFGVSFVVPPSGNVLIEFQIQAYNGGSGLGTLFAGLSTANATSGYSALEDIHEKVFWDTSARFAADTVLGSWTLTGLTAGASLEYWIGFKSTSTTGTPTIRWGSNATGRYPDFIMKAVALPATITT